MIGFIIWSIIAILFLGIGISNWKAKEAVGFFTFVNPPVVNDIKSYNHSVSMLWIVTAVILEIMGVPFILLEQNSPMFLFVIFGVVALMLIMMVVYIKIATKYKM